MDKYTIAPPAGSTNNSIGAVDRPWHEGHFDALKLGGGDLGTYLAESTGFGIISGCEPTISGLTVSVASGVVHLPDGTRKEISTSTVTLDAADASNPRIDLVYIDSTGVISKVTGATATETAYNRTYTVTTNFVANDTVTISDVTVTATASSQNGLEFTVGDSIADSARNLITTLNNNDTFISKFIAASNGATITVFEKNAGGNNQPGSMTVTGTGAITTNSVSSNSQPVMATPTTPDNCIAVAKVIVTVNATKGKLLDNRDWVKKGQVEFLYPQNISYTAHGDCQVIKTAHKVMMIDSGAVTNDTPPYLISYLVSHGINKVDVVLVTHYHGDHYLNIQTLLNQNTVDFSDTTWLLPPDIPNTSGDGGVSYSTVAGWIGSDDKIIVTDSAFDFCLEPDVNVKLFNCSAFDRLYYQAMGLNTLNAYSTFTTVYHNNVKAFYTGDGLGAETRNYILGQTEKVSLYKIAHHGHGDYTNVPPYDKRFLFNLNPDVALFNSAAGQWKWADNSGELSYIASIGTNTGWLALASAEFVSDGDCLLNISNNMSWKIVQDTIETRDIYVDASSTSAHPNGTKENPFPTITQALARVKDTKETNIYLANGTYALTQRNKFNVAYRFDTITLSSVYIGNGRADFIGNTVNITGTMTTSNALVNSTNTNFVFNISASGSINIVNSQLYIDNVTEENTTTDTSSYTGIIINHSSVRISNLVSSKVYNLFGLQAGSTAYIGTVKGTLIGQIFADASADNHATGWAQINWVDTANSTYVYSINTALCKNMVDRGQLIYYTPPAFT